MIDGELIERRIYADKVVETRAITPYYVEYEDAKEHPNLPQGYYVNAVEYEVFNDGTRKEIGRSTVFGLD